VLARGAVLPGALPGGSTTGGDGERDGEGVVDLDQLVHVHGDGDGVVGDVAVEELPATVCGVPDDGDGSAVQDGLRRDDELVVVACCTGGRRVRARQEEQRLGHGAAQLLERGLVGVPVVPGEAAGRVRPDDLQGRSCAVELSDGVEVAVVLDGDDGDGQARGAVGVTGVESLAGLERQALLDDPASEVVEQRVRRVLGKAGAQQLGVLAEAEPDGVRHRALVTGEVRAGDRPDGDAVRGHRGSQLRESSLGGCVDRGLVVHDQNLRLPAIRLVGSTGRRRRGVTSCRCCGVTVARGTWRSCAPSSGPTSCGGAQGVGGSEADRGSRGERTALRRVLLPGADRRTATIER